MLVAVADRQFFKLNFASEIDMDSGEVPTTACEKLPIPTSRGVVTAEVRYAATPTGQPARNIQWNFELTDKVTFMIESSMNPERPQLEPNERFAQALASGMGWPTLTPRT